MGEDSEQSQDEEPEVDDSENAYDDSKFSQEEIDDSPEYDDEISTEFEQKYELEESNENTPDSGNQEIEFEIKNECDELEESEVSDTYDGLTVSEDDTNQIPELEELEQVEELESEGPEELAHPDEINSSEFSDMSWENSQYSDMELKSQYEDMKWGSLFPDADEELSEEEEKLEETRRLLRELTETRIETVEELDKVVEENENVKDDPAFEATYEYAKAYLEFRQKVKEKYTKEEYEELTHVDLAREFGYRIADVSHWWRGIVPNLIKNLESLGKAQRKREILDAIFNEQDLVVPDSEKGLENLVDRVYHLYFEEGLTQRQTASKLGVSRGTVQKVFRHEGWIGRHVEKAVDSDEVCKLYIKDKMTQKEIAKKLGISKTYVYKILRESLGQGDKRKNRKKSVDLENALFLYLEKGFTQEQVAKELGISASTFRRRISEFQGEVKPGQEIGIQSSEQSQKSSLKNKRSQNYYMSRVSFLNSQKKLTVENTLIETQSVSKTEKLSIKSKPSRRRIKRNAFDDIVESHRLYYELGLSQKEVAERMGISVKRLRKIFRSRGWRAGPRGAVLDLDTIHRLRFEEELSTIEIARLLGISSKRLKEAIKELGWETEHGNQPSISIEEKGKVQGSNSYRLEAKKLREEIFGRECTICGASRDEKSLVIHRKDGTSHERELIWDPKRLRKLNPNDWSALCPHCHHAIHWTMDNFSMNWDTMMQAMVLRSEGDDSVGQENDRISNQFPKRAMELQLSRKEIRELRFDMFGDECRVCRRHREDVKLILHRKDGTPHHRNSTWTSEFVIAVDPDDWVMLCVRCHNGIHWLMKHLGLNWNRVESSLESESYEID